MKFLNFDMKSKSVVIYINANYVYFQTIFKATTIISLHPLILTSTMHKMVLPWALCVILSLRPECRIFLLHSASFPMVFYGHTFALLVWIEHLAYQLLLLMASCMPSTMTYTTTRAPLLKSAITTSTLSPTRCWYLLFLTFWLSSLPILP